MSDDIRITRSGKPVSIQALSDLVDALEDHPDRVVWEDFLNRVEGHVIVIAHLGGDVQITPDSAPDGCFWEIGVED